MTKTMSRNSSLRHAHIKAGYRRMRRRNQQAADLLSPRRNLEVTRHDNCPTPQKKAYPTQDDAEEVMAYFWLRPRPDKKLPSRVYQCPCGRWHMTSMPSWKLPDNVRSLRPAARIHTRDPQPTAGGHESPGDGRELAA